MTYNDCKNVEDCYNKAIDDVTEMLTDYPTTEDLNTTLADYPTTEQVSTALESYATTEYVDTAISGVKGAWDEIPYADNTSINMIQYGNYVVGETLKNEICIVCNNIDRKNVSGGTITPERNLGYSLFFPIGYSMPANKYYEYMLGYSIRNIATTPETYIVNLQIYYQQNAQLQVKVIYTNIADGTTSNLDNQTVKSRVKFYVKTK